MHRYSAMALTLLFGAFLGACTADVEESGELPDVDVSGGEMPSVDVDPADVDISTDTQVVEVPDIDIQAEDDDVDN